jgi:predicted metal-dependent peptidase
MSKFTNLEKSKSQLLLHHCFFANLLLRMPLEEDENCPTMATDGKRFIYNPKFVDGLTVQELMAVIVHEVLHVIFEHMLRRATRDHMKWNMAADYAINLVVRDQGLTLPKQCLLDDKFKDLYAEKIYDQLPALKNIKVPSGWNVGGVDDMKGAHGEELSEEAREEISKEVKAAVKESALVAKMAGKLPAGLERILGDLLNPRIPWREVLAKFLTVTIQNDMTWRLPNARYVPQGIYLPKIGEPTIGDMIFVVDTSGSITDGDLIDLMSEVRGIMMAFPSKTFWLLGCDTQVASAQELSFQDDIHKPKGGGGTCYKEPFKWVDKEGLEPACLIYLTDGACNSFPDKVPDYPVLWVLTEDPQYYKSTWDDVKFGDVIVMDDRDMTGRRRRRY